MSGTPTYLLLVDAPNRAVPINGMFHARLEPLRAFVSSYPIGGILRTSEKCGRPINGIPIDTTSAFTDQPRLCCRKHHSLQHHPCFGAMINLQPRIRRPRCIAQVPPAPPLTLLLIASAMFYFLRASEPLGELLRSPFPFLLDFDLRETFFRRPSSRVLFFGRLQYHFFSNDSNTV